MNKQEAGRLVDLDLLRLFAIVLVVVSHGRSGGTSSLNAYLLTGYLGVGVFFFISGYLLQRGYPSIEASSHARLFLNRRAWRIFPLYLVALAIALLVGNMGVDAGGGLSAGAILAHLLGLQMVFYPSYISVLAIWFVGAIVVYYLLYPLLVYRNPSVGRLLIRAFVILLLMGGAWAVTGLFDKGLIECFPLFVMGVVAGMVNFLWSDRYRLLRRGLAVAAVPAIGLAYLSYALMESGGGGSLSRIVAIGEVIGIRYLAILGLAFLVREVYLLLEPRSPRVLHLITAGATASYAVYLFHGSVGHVLSSLIEGSSATPTAVYFATLPLLFVVCYYVQRATDRLIVSVRRRRPWDSGGG